MVLMCCGMGRAPEPPSRWADSLVSGAPMSRRSLRPQLNQIRGWVRQGRTDAWIAHQLEVTVQQIQAFKREQGLEVDGDTEGVGGAVDYDDEIDLRAEDEDEKPTRRRRGRRGGRRGRRKGPSTLEATFDHGEEGYGLWLDPAVQDDPVYAEHWAGHRPVEITIEEDQIVIRRAGAEDDDSDD